jgi:regulation of enolase protein 1 (concanavalin A-like superfamily)
VDTDTAVNWTAGRWLNEPPAWQVDGSDLVVTAAEGSDFWRTTSYGFVHDNGHALLTDLPVGAAVEVAFVADLSGRFDQAGVLVWADEETWIKAGLERSDGELQLGAVVTSGRSDWSLSPVPSWAGAVVTVRASRGPDALTVRARCGDGPWQLIRLAPLTAAGPVGAGPLVSAPSRAGLTVRFTGFRQGPADASLHASE